MAVIAVVGTYQCAEMQRTALGRGVSEAPIADHAAVYRLREIAFIGLPWPTNTAGIGALE